jgi:hypothetical protein
MLGELKPAPVSVITTGVSMNIDVVATLKRGDPEEIKKVQEKRY